MLIKSHREKTRCWGRIQAYNLNAPKWMEDLGLDGMIDLLRNQADKYKDMPKHLLHEALRRGELAGSNINLAYSTPIDFIVPADGGPNKVVNIFYQDLFARFQKTPTADQNLFIEYLALGTNYVDAAASGDTQLASEEARFVISDYYNNSAGQFTASVFLSSAIGNLTPDSIDGATSPSTSQFTLTTPAALGVGDLFEIELPSGFEECVVVYNVAGTITLSALESVDNLLPETPVVGAEVTPMYGEGGLFMGTLATTTANTGNLLNRKLFRFKKSSAVLAGALLDAQLNFLSVGS